MKNVLKWIMPVIFLAMISCENDVELNDANPVQKPMGFKKNRLVFSSKEELATFYKEYADASEEKLSEFMMPLYEKGFYSLRPIVTEANETFVYNHYKKVMKKQDPNARGFDLIIAPDGGEENPVVLPEDYIENLDDLEDIIGDDTFAALLNSEAEIQIANELYKYTDVGLFVTNVDKEAILTNYLVSKNISTEITTPTSLAAREAISAEYPEGGLVEINSNITYFKVAPDANIDYVGGGGTSTNVTYNNPTTDSSFLSFSNNLQNCDQESGLWNTISNWFGDNYKCIDRYQTRRRVKTKAFNYDYLAVYHLGVKCVHQYRGWTGFWRTEAVDEMRLVVEAVQFQYDTNKLLNNAMINNRTLEKAYYINDQKITYNPNSMTMNGITYTGLDHSSLPQIFQNSGKGLTFEWFGSGITELDHLIQGGIDSQLKASRLNQHFYNFAYDAATGFLKNALNNYNLTLHPNRTMVLKYPENGKLIVQKSAYHQGFGNGISKQTFDWGVEVRFSSSQSGNGSWNISGGQGDQLIRPEKFRAKVIGAARGGTAWHGSKLAQGI